MNKVKKKLRKLYSKFIPRNNDTELNNQFMLVVLPILLEYVFEIYAQTPQEVLDEINIEYGSFKEFSHIELKKFMGLYTEEE